MGGTTTIAWWRNAIDLGQYEVLFGGRNARAAIAFLLSRPPHCSAEVERVP